jgi:hypothetical protein
MKICVSDLFIDLFILAVLIKNYKELMMKKLIVICLFLIINNSYALTLNDANVYSEADTTAETECGISNSSSIAAVESVLRQNRIVIKSNSKFYFYINTVAIESGNGCAASTSLVVHTYAYVKIRSLNNRGIYSKVTLCDVKGAIFTGPSYDLETRINEKLRSFSEECISEIEKIKFE